MYKTITALSIAIAISALSGAALHTPTIAQEEDAANQGPITVHGYSSTGTARAVPAAPGAPQPFAYSYTVGGFGPRDNKVGKLVEKMSDDELSSADQRDARDELEEILSEQFDADLTQRSEQIVALEKKIETLKDQLDRRRDSKTRLIELRIELLMNEAQGLGFPKAWNKSGGSIFPEPRSTVTVPAVGQWTGPARVQQQIRSRSNSRSGGSSSSQSRSVR